MSSVRAASRSANPPQQYAPLYLLSWAYSLGASRKNRQKKELQCPYQHEVKDGHVFIDGEDFGTEDEFERQGDKLSRLVQLWNGVKNRTQAIT